MLHSNKQGFRSLQGDEMKKILGGTGTGSGCPASACVFRGSYCQIVQGTCGGSAGDCYCTGTSGNKVERSYGCSATLNGPIEACPEEMNTVSNVSSFGNF